LSVSLHENEAPSRHYGVLGLDQSNFNRSDVVTAGLSSVNVAMSGYLKPMKGATTRFEPLLQSSNQAQPLPTERFALLFDPGKLRDGFRATGERYAIGARVTGNIKTAFPGGPPAGASVPPGTTALKTSTKPLQLIVFADVDMLADYLWVRQQNLFGQRVTQAWANNGDLMLNVLDNLSGSADLISVRGRATFTRPFERVEALRRSADERFRSKEQELEQQLRTTEEKLTALESRRNDKSSVILTPEQERELSRFQDEKLQVRKELRNVRLGLDVDIRKLGTTLKVLNIIVVPALLAVIALLVVGWRRRRRAQHAVLHSKGQT
jgi:gliding motility-associatede transport system auxiliary component